VRELGPPEWILSGSSDREHAIDRTTALALSILAVASILVTPLWGRMSDRAGPLRCLAVASLGLGLVLLVTSRVRSIEGYLALRAVAAVFMSGVMTLAYSAASKRVPPERRSLAFSLVQSGIQIGLSVGPLLGQAFVPIDRAVANDSGVRGLFVVAACCLLLAGVGMAFLRFLPADEPVEGVLLPEEKT
jgi:MFS family permease